MKEYQPLRGGRRVRVRGNPVGDRAGLGETIGYVELDPAAWKQQYAH